MSKHAASPTVAPSPCRLSKDLQQGKQCTSALQTIVKGATSSDIVCCAAHRVHWIGVDFVVSSVAWLAQGRRHVSTPSHVRLVHFAYPHFALSHSYYHGRSQEMAASPKCCYAEDCIQHSRGHHAVVTTLRSDAYLPLVEVLVTLHHTLSLHVRRNCRVRSSAATQGCPSSSTRCLATSAAQWHTVQENWGSFGTGTTSPFPATRSMDGRHSFTACTSSVYQCTSTVASMQVEAQHMT